MKPYSWPLPLTNCSRYLINYQFIVKKKKKWNINVNVNKTKRMLFKCSNRPENFEVSYDGTALEIVRNFIYLGVNICCYGKFFQAPKHLANQAPKTLYSLSNVFNYNTLCIQENNLTH